jgi:hypothetical protein
MRSKSGSDAGDEEEGFMRVGGVYEGPERLSSNEERTN